jgi:hypothetical protein
MAPEEQLVSLTNATGKSRTGDTMQLSQDQQDVADFAGLSVSTKPIKGKAYANRQSEKDRPKGDFYATPRSLVWAAEQMILSEFSLSETVLDPCSGRGAISSELRKLGFRVVENDLFFGGDDYLRTSYTHQQVIANPPFSLWDAFVEKAKSESEKVLMIGRLNYFGTQSRLKNGLWHNLKAVYCFDRYVDYRTPERSDGMFHVGAMATAWFLWERDWRQPPMLHFTSVQKYASLGNLK